MRLLAAPEFSAQARSHKGAGVRERERASVSVCVSVCACTGGATVWCALGQRMGIPDKTFPQGCVCAQRRWVGSWTCSMACVARRVHIFVCTVVARTDANTEGRKSETHMSVLTETCFTRKRVWVMWTSVHSGVEQMALEDMVHVTRDTLTSLDMHGGWTRVLMPWTVVPHARFK